MTVQGGGWFGLLHHALYFLSVVGADKDEKGRYKIAGKEPAVGLGGDEIVIPAETIYFINGKPCGWAAGLNGTSYGTHNVTVI